MPEEHGRMSATILVVSQRKFVLVRSSAEENEKDTAGATLLRLENASTLSCESACFTNVYGTHVVPGAQKSLERDFPFFFRRSFS